MTNELKKKISEIIIKSESFESDIDHLMKLLRKLHEGEHQEAFSYLILNFFCDWTKHTKVERNFEGSAVILDLNRGLAETIEISDRSALLASISSMISFENLQHELFTFLVDNHLPQNITTEKQM